MEKGVFKLSNEKQKILLFINLFFNTLFLFLIQPRRMHIYIFTPSNEEKKKHSRGKKKTTLYSMHVCGILFVFILWVCICAHPQEVKYRNEIYVDFCVLIRINLVFVFSWVGSPNTNVFYETMCM